MTAQDMLQTVKEGPRGVAFIVALCGARYEGAMETPKGRLVLFTDPVTRSTASLWEPEVTVGTVWRKLAEVRERFRTAMLEAGAR